MKNAMFIFALITLFFFSLSETSLAQRTVRNLDWQSLGRKQTVGQYLQKPQPNMAATPQQRIVTPQQRRLVTPPRQVAAPRQQQVLVYPAPRTYSTPAQSAYVPMPNFDNSTNQLLAQANQLISDSKKLMQLAEPEVRRRQLEYQNASPQRRMQMDAEKQYVLEKARINMEGFYNDRWARSFDPSAKVIYLSTDY